MKNQVWIIVALLIGMSLVVGPVKELRAEDKKAKESISEDGDTERVRRYRKHRTRAGMLKGKERFLRFSKAYYEAVKDPHAAIGFAALGVKERHRRAGTPLEAVPELQKILSSTKNQGARNIVLFTIRQIYDHEDDKDGSERINNQILEENLSALAN